MDAIELLEDPTKHFHYYSNACSTCHAYGKEIKLKRCGGCKMIAYCSKEHQSEHWPRHKQFCRVIKTFIKGNDTIYGIDRSWENESAWIRRRQFLITSIKAKLGRELSCGESEMLAFPRSCQICHETNPSKLTDCKECPDASFCLKHSKNEEHSSRCETSKLCFETNNAMVKKRCFAPYVEKFVPQNMDQVVGLHLSEILSLENPTSAKSCVAIFSERLARARSFLYALTKLCRPESRKMTIHVICADSNVLVHDFFQKYFFEYDESVQELNLVYFCPELPNKVETQYYGGCTANVRYVKTSYVEFAATKSFIKPDYVVGFDSTLPDPDVLVDEIWLPTFKILVKLRCPLIMTAFSKDQSEWNQERINSMLQKEVKIFWTGKNPFSGMKPFRSFNGSFIYTSNYLTIYEKLA